MTADLLKLRRFALAIALVLITYSLAGLELQPDSVVRPFGLHFKIGQPDLLPIGLMASSAYAALRFMIQGVLLGESPTRRRARLRDRLTSARRTRFGVRTMSFAYEAEAEANADVTEFNRAFPSLPSEKLATSEFEPPPGPLGDSGPGWVVSVSVSLRSRVLGRIDDVDYSAPVWLNGVALALAVWRLVWE